MLYTFSATRRRVRSVCKGARDILANKTYLRNQFNSVLPGVRMPQVMPGADPSIHSAGRSAPGKTIQVLFTP